EAVLALREARQHPAGRDVPRLLIDLRQRRLTGLSEREQDRLEAGAGLDVLRRARAEQVAEAALAGQRDRVRVAGAVRRVRRTSRARARAVERLEHRAV